MQGRAITTVPTTNQQVIAFKGPSQSQHPPNQEEWAADALTQEIKREPEQNPEQPPA